MTTPIAYALSYPERLPLDLPPLDLCRLGKLHFSAPDRKCFPCLDLAYDAIRRGGTTPAVLNAANEIAVEAFLCEKVGFLDIPRIIAMVIEGYSCTAVGGLDEILAADAWARQTAESVIVEIQGAAYA